MESNSKPLQKLPSKKLSSSGSGVINCSGCLFTDIAWVVPLPSNSDHQDDITFLVRNPQLNLHFHYGKGDNPRYCLNLCKFKNQLGPNPNGPLSKLLCRPIRFSGFFGVRSGTVLLEISWIYANLRCLI